MAERKVYVAFSDDDDHGDDGDANGETKGQEAARDREYRAMEAQYSNVGYLEGLETGKEQALQAGFNEGYAKGLKLSTQVSYLRGIVSTIKALSETNTGRIQGLAVTSELLALQRELDDMAFRPPQTEEEERVYLEKEVQLSRRLYNHLSGSELFPHVVAGLKVYIESKETT